MSSQSINDIEAAVIAEDLEDGEIESDEDDDEPIFIKNKNSPVSKTAENNNKIDLSPSKQIPIINLVDNEVNTSKPKFKRPAVVDDDFAGNIENAIAAALKKDGIEPPMPKLLEKRSKDDDSEKGGTNVSSTSSKRKNRKRKKRDLEKDKSSENKRSRHDEVAQVKNDEEDIDDALMYEMLGIRGGSPPLHNAGPATGPTILPTPTYFSDDSYSSYDSYDSETEYRKKGERSSRYSKKNRKDHKRASRDRSRDRGRDRERSSRRKNRNSDDGGEDSSNRNNTICLAYLRGQCQNDDCSKKHEGRPERKLELCKFYLKECCAKKDKCLYMHADFPCKYYYLGMECIYKKECKYMHGEPLSDTLRNILLKHIETAPKEILGTFRRISRDNAIQLLNKQHALLCKKYNVENTHAQTQSQPINVLSNSNNNKTSLLGNSPNSSNNSLNESNNILSNSNVNLQSVITNQLSVMTSGIPSLLDMIIPSPNGFENDLTNNNGNKLSNMHDNGKPRKSRWTDTAKQQLQQSTTNASNSNNNKSENLTETTDVPNFLKLQYLNGILRQDQIEKLIQLGVETLQQLTTLSLMQLNAVGLTVNQLNEIQLNTMNLEKLGIFKMDPSKTSSKLNIDNVMDSSSNQTFGGYLKDNQKDSTTPFIIDAMKASTNDVDMRVLPADVGTISNKASIDNKEHKLPEKDSILCIASPEPQFNDRRISPKYISEQKKTERNVLNTVDYSQYLKDSNINDDKMFMMDDEKDDDHKLIIEEDEDQLKIDESAFDIDNEKSNNSCDDGRETPVGENNFDDNSNSSSKILPPIISAVFDQTKSKKVIDLSSTVSNMLKAQAAASKTNTSDISNQLTSVIGYFQTNNSGKNEITKENEMDIIDIEKEIDRKFNIKKVNNTLSVNNFYGSFETKSDKEKEIGIIESNNKTYIFQDPRKNLNDTFDLKNLYSRSKSNENIISKRSPSPIKSPQYKEQTLYDRPSIYDGNINEADDNNSDSTELKNIADKDMRISEFIDSSDLDLRLPFKPVMTNFTPATEIDGSISSNNPIIYRVIGIEIPKPNYKEIRRNFPANEKTLDPRLRRIFCLPEDSLLNEKILHLNQINIYESDSESSHSITPTTISTTSIPPKEKQETISSNTPNLARLDPRKRNIENNLLQSPSSESNTITNQAPLSGQSTANSQTNALPTQQNNDIRMILQKSNWYKNLNSKYKIMINQQLAMVSTELKKFHQNPSTNKIFDISFIMQNQTLQQILTNLCIYIDDSGMIRQVDSDSESSDNGNCNNVNKLNNPNNNSNNNPINIGNQSNINNNPNINNSNSNIPVNNNTSLGNSILGYPSLLEFNSGGGVGGLPLAGTKAKSNQLMNLGNLIDLPALNNNAMEFLRGPPPLHSIQQQQQKLQRFGQIAAVLNNQFGGNSGGGGPGPSIHFGQDMRPGLLGVAPGIGFNNQFGGISGVGPRPDIDNNNLLPLLSNDNLLSNPQFSGVGCGNGNFPNFFNDPRNRNLNKNNNNNNNNKRFNNFGMNNNIGNNNNNNNRDRRNFNDNRTNRDNRNRDKRKI